MRLRIIRALCVSANGDNCIFYKTRISISRLKLKCRCVSTCLFHLGLSRDRDGIRKLRAIVCEQACSCKVVCSNLYRIYLFQIIVCFRRNLYFNGFHDCRADCLRQLKPCVCGNLQTVSKTGEVIKITFSITRAAIRVCRGYSRSSIRSCCCGNFCHDLSDRSRCSIIAAGNRKGQCTRLAVVYLRGHHDGNAARVDTCRHNEVVLVVAALCRDGCLLVRVINCLDFVNRVGCCLSILHLYLKSEGLACQRRFDRFQTCSIVSYPARCSGGSAGVFLRPELNVHLVIVVCAVGVSFCSYGGTCLYH